MAGLFHPTGSAPTHRQPAAIPGQFPRGLAGLLAATLVAAVAGCGSGSSHSYESDPQALLREGKQTVDAASALHFKLASDGASGSGVIIKDGEGDARRPDGFTGTFDVIQNGVSLGLQVVSTGGKFYVKLPFIQKFASTDPSAYGFSDPGKLLDPTTGLSSLLSSTKSSSLGERDRLSGEELYEVDVVLPGQKVKDLLTSADPAQDVKGRMGINVDSHEVRRVVLTGPFFEKGKDATFTLLLTGYGENVSVTPPA